jgi:hypothetical protein
LFSALQPARPESGIVRTWTALGSLHIALADGKPFWVGLFGVPKGPGAFAAGESAERRFYYRGGKTSELEGALKEAWRAAREGGGPEVGGRPGVK